MALHDHSDFLKPPWGTKGSPLPPGPWWRWDQVIKEGEGLETRQASSNCSGPR